MSLQFSRMGLHVPPCIILHLKVSNYIGMTSRNHEIINDYRRWVAVRKVKLNQYTISACIESLPCTMVLACYTRYRIADIV